MAIYLPSFFFCYMHSFGLPLHEEKSLLPSLFLFSYSSFIPQ